MWNWKYISVKNVFKNIKKNPPVCKIHKTSLAQECTINSCPSKQELTIQDFPRDLLRRVTLSVSESLRAQSDLPTVSNKKADLPTFGTLWIAQSAYMLDRGFINSCQISASSSLSESLKNKNTVLWMLNLSRLMRMGQTDRALMPLFQKGKKERTNYLDLKVFRS